MQIHYKQHLNPKRPMNRSMIEKINRHSLSFSHGAVSLEVKLKGLFVISGLRGLILIAKSPSSVSLSFLFGACPPATASSELIRLLPRESFCLATRWPGGFCGIARCCGRDDPPWKSENDDTATSPMSGERGWADWGLASNDSCAV